MNVSSEASLRGWAAGVAYTASKHAVNGLTKSTAFFYQSRGIRANAVVPGGVLTNIEGAFRSEQAAAIVGPVLQATLPSVATAEQVAAAITFLLSGDAANINGAILPAMAAGQPSEDGPRPPPDRERESPRPGAPMAGRSASWLLTGLGG